MIHRRVAPFISVAPIAPIASVAAILAAAMGLAACSQTAPEVFDGTWQSDNHQKVMVIKLKPPRQCELQLASDPNEQPIACLYDISGNSIALHMEIETLKLEYSRESDTLTWAGPPVVKLRRIAPEKAAAASAAAASTASMAIAPASASASASASAPASAPPPAQAASSSAAAEPAPPSASDSPSRP